MSQKRHRVDSEEVVTVIKQGVDVGRMVDSSQADDRKIIRLVKDRRLLYARNNIPVASYYSQVKSLWEEVAHEMGWSVADVRRKWSHIRNSYSRHLRNEMYGTRTGKGRMVSRWYLADELEFLREHMATDMRQSPYSTYAPTFLEMDLGEQSSTSSGNVEQIDVKPFIHSPWFSLPAQKSPLKFEMHNQSDDSSSSHAFGPDENASYFQFFRGIYNDYQELNPKKQRLFKRQCLNFLHDLLDEEDNNKIISYESHEDNPINLTNSAQGSEDEKEEKICIMDSYTLLPTINGDKE